MSHFDDIEPLFWGDGPKSAPGCFVFAVIAVVAIVWAASADSESEELCRKHDETYVDSNSRYTLCKRKDGTIVSR
jgi:hypothetical protein